MLIIVVSLLPFCHIMDSKLINANWVMIWFVLKAFDLKAWEITATASDGLIQTEEIWMTCTTQSTGQYQVGWHRTTIYEYKLRRWAAVINTVSWELCSGVWNSLRANRLKTELSNLLLNCLLLCCHVARRSCLFLHDY